MESDNESVLGEENLEQLQPVVTEKSTDKPRHELNEDEENISKPPSATTSASNSPDDSNKDEYAIFAELVALKLRKLTPNNKLCAQERITGILLSLESKQLNEGKSLEAICPINVPYLKSKNSGHSSKDGSSTTPSYKNIMHKRMA